jgi:L-2,4-diaminobutyric acid acetyltransferase
VSDITYRTPSIEDGAEIWKMVDEAAALDANSSYAYFMACRNFAATSVVAEVDGEVAGMVTAYPLPADAQKLFVWQVGVREKFQGMGIARGMLESILNRDDCAAVRYIETTIAPGNEASEALFSRVAANFNAHIEARDVYRDELFPDAEHQIERLFVIGPITRSHNEIRILRAADVEGADPDSEGYVVMARLDGYDQPAFEPANPVFSTLEDARHAAEEVRPALNAREIVIVQETIVTDADPDSGDDDED